MTKFFSGFLFQTLSDHMLVTIRPLHTHQPILTKLSQNKAKGKRNTCKKFWVLTNNSWQNKAKSVCMNSPAPYTPGIRPKVTSLIIMTWFTHKTNWFCWLWTHTQKEELFSGSNEMKWVTMQWHKFIMSFIDLHFPLSLGLMCCWSYHPNQLARPFWPTF